MSDWLKIRENCQISPANISCSVDWDLPSFNLAQIGNNDTNPFKKITFQYISSIKSDLKTSWICPIWWHSGQFCAHWSGVLWGTGSVVLNTLKLSSLYYVNNILIDSFLFQKKHFKTGRGFFLSCDQVNSWNSICHERMWQQNTTEHLNINDRNSIPLCLP